MPLVQLALEALAVFAQGWSLTERPVYTFALPTRDRQPGSMHNGMVINQYHAKLNWGSATLQPQATSMSVSLTAASLFSLFLLSMVVPPLVFCSKRPYKPEDFRSLQLTPHSVSGFGDELKRGPTSPFVLELREGFVKNLLYQQLCLKYVIGSVVLFGKADEKSLRTIRELCNGVISSPLSGLLVKLANANNADTVAQFVAENVWNTITIMLFMKLIEEDWSVMKGLTMKVLEMLKNDLVRSDKYHEVLKHLPVEQQYEMIRTGGVALEKINSIYCSAEERLLLREIFFLARCSCNPDPKIRKAIADKDPAFKEFLGSDETGCRIEGQCMDKVPRLTEEILCHISGFMDIETRVFVMPLVCKVWRNLCRKSVTDEARVQDFYLRDLSYIKLKTIHTMMPWKWYLGNMANGRTYFGQCIGNGGLDRIEPTHWLMSNVKKYLKAVTGGKCPLPRFEDCSTQYETFMKLFERAYGYCKSDKPVLDKPAFFTMEQYEQAVYGLVYEKRLVVRVSELLVVYDLPRLFSIVREDEELMKRLLEARFASFEKASLVLILYGHTKTIPDKLARLIFKQTNLFYRFAEPKVVRSNEYYSYMVESNILPAVIRHYNNHMVAIPQLLIFLILSFRDNAAKIDMLAASMAREFHGGDDAELQKTQGYFALIPFERLIKTEGYTAEDFEFFKGVMKRCGLWNGSKV